MYRKLLDNPIISKPFYCHLWTILLILAQHKASEYIWNGERRTLCSGQLMTGRKKLAEISGISESQVERILTYLENEQQITQQTTNRYRIITINNWAKYQNNSSRCSPRYNSEQPKDTYKNERE